MEIDLFGKTPLQNLAAGLGATLYVPATRDDLLALALGQKYPALRSLVFCLEDSVAEADSSAALANLHAVLGQLHLMQALNPDRPAIFIRPRNAEMLSIIAHMPGIVCVDGFVVPKATADTLPAWLLAMPTTPHYLLPTIETREAFDSAEMRRLREQLLAVHERVLVVRIGGNDLLQTIGARRSAVRTAYDGPLGYVIAKLTSTFIPWGFAMSAPVFETFEDANLLAEEVGRDIEHGLLTKTAIHPLQVDVIHKAYRVRRADFDVATAIAGNRAAGVFALDGAMCEPATHLRWAHATIARADIFGLERSRPEHISIAS